MIPENQLGASVDTTVLVTNALLPGEEGCVWRERLAERYHRAVHGYILVKCRSGFHLAEELAQTVLQKLFVGTGETNDSMPKLMSFDRSKGTFRVWVKTMAHNEWVDYHRRQRAQKRDGNTAPFEDGAMTVADARDLVEPEVAFDRGWAIGILAEALRDATVVKKYPFAPALIEVYGAGPDALNHDIVRLLGANSPTHARGILLKLRTFIRPTVERLIGEEAPFPSDPGMSVNAVYFLTGLLQTPPASLDGS